MKKLLLLICAMLLAACGQGFNGTYADSDGNVEYKFESGGKVTTKTMRTEVKQKYVVEGKKVKIASPFGDVVYTLQDDGSMTGPIGVKLIK